MSSNPCGCDPEASWVCKWHQFQHATRLDDSPAKASTVLHGWHYFTIECNPVDYDRMEEMSVALLPTEDKQRKDLPVWDGVVMYFPKALLAVAEVSRIGNDQHNPGQPLHWDRAKSTDQFNTAIRHMMDHALGTVLDTDGARHLAKAAWRVLAALEVSIEAETTPKVVDLPYPATDEPYCPESNGSWACERPGGHSGRHMSWGGGYVGPNHPDNFLLPDGEWD